MRQGMSRSQKEQLYSLRGEGKGPTYIAHTLGVSVSTITSYLRRHPAPPGMTACKECGAWIETSTGHRPRVFCSAACKMKWWNKHRLEGRKNLVSITCQFCRKEFMDYASNQRKYCSTVCYHHARENRGDKTKPDQL